MNRAASLKHRRIRAGFLALALAHGPLALAAQGSVAPVKITAADAVYADIAQQVGGTAVSVTIAGKSKAHAPLLLYPPGASRAPVAVPMPGAQAWFHVAAVKALAQTLAQDLSRMKPQSAAEFDKNLKQFNDKLAPVESKIQFLSHTYRGTKVFATDLIYQNMLDDLHFGIRELAAVRQLAQNGPARAAAIKKLKSQIDESSVGVLVYDVQSKSPVTRELEKQAMTAGVPTIGIPEEKPSGLDYQAWMLRTLNTLHGGLNEAAQ
ncbi:MAG: zinc ABC transporter substrate-binding protein [Hyphomicrobiales bacterium]|nr:zinc ABC transporter substrate-binding protein [Hyphomicrobiales bacterium]MDE2115433.1 zinc ABC transporter substrate-binding protein [Hyphomicrobiales bacterium]